MFVSSTTWGKLRVGSWNLVIVEASYEYSEKTLSDLEGDEGLHLRR